MQYHASCDEVARTHHFKKMEIFLITNNRSIYKNASHYTNILEPNRTRLNLHLTNYVNFT